ncbi:MULTISPECIES: DUF2793 domain-containing protein [unclassified Yoonia]|uniref:DUF2793 domain-containing protein n=1 Tax=unclassified Yoonia TaxID=2629118 RepID=UPI002AFECFF8|nr:MULTISPECIES: DUF2793 domain-containing protein [unclassified Yoonia]
MSDQSPNLSLPFIMPAQAQKHVTHNEAIELLDLIVQLTLVSVTQTAPPPDPAEGAAWAVPAGAVGAWAGQAGLIATWRGGGWLFVAARDGWTAFVTDAAALHIRMDGKWSAKGHPPDLQNLPAVGVNATADATNRLSLRAPATLFDNEGAGHQIKINKAAAGDTGSLLFQTGYSGRAEMGLAGSDDFTIKTSPDGTLWRQALTIAAATGQVQLSGALRLTPISRPATGQAGDLYFDSATAKLCCFDGTLWHDLF